MTVFTFKGVDRNGASETGTIEASSKDLAFDTLQSRGIVVFELSEGSLSQGVDLPWYRRDIRFTEESLSLRDQAEIAELLATLFDAHLAVPEVLRIVQLSARQPRVKRHFEKVAQRVADGADLSVAFSEENELFSPIFVSFLSISDSANARPQLLRELSKFFQKQNEIRQQILSALIYPAILVVAAIGLLAIVILYLAPNLAPIFESVGKEPPGTLSLLISANRFLSDYGFWVFVTCVGCGIGGLLTAQTQFGRRLWSNFLAKLPLIGNLQRHSLLAQLSLACSLLLRSGLPLTQALRMAGDMQKGHNLFALRFSQAAEKIEQGGSAAAVFDGDMSFPGSFQEIFRIGETTNRLPSMLSALSEALFAQVDIKSKRALALLTPMITLILGLGIGFLIYTLMGAILEVNQVAF